MTKTDELDKMFELGVTKGMEIVLEQVLDAIKKVQETISSTPTTKEIARDHVEGDVQDQKRAEYVEFAHWDEFGAMRGHSRFPEGKHE